MSQQHMDFDETDRKESASYTTGYEEIPHYGTYSSGSIGQKLSGQDAGGTPTAGQRLALAIVSLVLLFLLIFAIMALALFGNLSPDIVSNFSPIIVFTSLGFIAVLIVVNVLFNRRR
ncbi:MAG TPA: hypothetical protein VIY29_15700 [Ktedonobacteraceae bacterium]